MTGWGELWRRAGWTARSSRTERPPAIVLGGASNALSVARSLSRLGVRVFCLGAPSKNVRFSRHCIGLRPPGDLRAPETWERFLLGPDSDFLRGAVLLVCDDHAIELVLRHEERLAEKFVLEESSREARRCLLDKLATYRMAARAGIATPRYWPVQTLRDVEALRDELRFPLLVKPAYSHKFERIFRRKYIAVDCYEQLLEEFPAVEEQELAVVLMEFIPGGDDLLCSYYSFLDERGEPRFHFTKRIIRRHPVHMGGGSCHVTDWNPEVAELGLRLFREVGLRGLGNVEFKRDERDGRLVLIECNARFTAANCLVAASGFDLAAFVYRRLIGEEPEPLVEYRRGMRLWSPWEDFHAFLELRQRGAITWPRWLASVARPHVLPYFAWDDPLPSIVTEARRVREIVSRRTSRLRARLARARGRGA